ncbi:MAG: hypothetical protein HYZ14_08370 [Bacteroidetes bacterium]|nr:hypothetical protein [Bacteroidota bacterium]
MHLSGVFILGSVFVLVSSCERCMKCSYTYTVTTIEQTVNGEEEVVTTYTGYLQDTDTTYLKDECVKSDEEFTIDDKYSVLSDTTTLDNFEYTCTEL